MIHFNGMSAYLGLFYAQRLGNHCHCIFIFTFSSIFDKQPNQIWNIFWPINLTHRSHPNKNYHSRPRSNSHKWVLHTLQYSTLLTIRYNLVSYPGHCLLGGLNLLHCLLGGLNLIQSAYSKPYKQGIKYEWSIKDKHT